MPAYLVPFHVIIIIMEHGGVCCFMLADIFISVELWKELRIGELGAYFKAACLIGIVPSNAWLNFCSNLVWPSITRYIALFTY